MLIQCDAEKQCTKCKQIKPLTDFYLYKGKPRWQCKPCHTGNPANVDPVRRAATHKRLYKKHIEEQPEKFLWKNAKSRAKKSGLAFTIDVEDVVIPIHCPYLLVELVRCNNDFAPSIDRIDSSKGYIKGNIQVMSRIANRMKSNATTEQLKQFAKSVLVLHDKEVSSDVDPM